MNSTKNHSKIRQFAQIAMMTAVLAALAQISIPLPIGVPITLQTFAVALIAYLLSGQSAMCTVAVYLVLGAAGIPVFASFRGGIQVFLGPTGGFLIGFLLMVLATALGRKSKQGIVAVVAGLIGLVLCHLLGLIWLSSVLKMSFAKAFMLASLPFLLKDVASVFAAYFLSKRISAILNKSGITIY